MKSTLFIVMLALISAYTLAALGALVGVLPPAAFLGSEVACFVYSLAGLGWICGNDSGHRTSVTHFA